MLPGPFFFGGAAVKRCRSYDLACESVLAKTNQHRARTQLGSEQLQQQCDACEDRPVLVDLVVPLAHHRIPVVAACLSFLYSSAELAPDRLSTLLREI